MPIYEYQCEACGRRFDRIQKFSDPPIEVCPTCGGRVHKLISSPAFQFKGTGWYITDYAKKDTGAEKSGEAKDGGTAKEGSSAEKPDAAKKEAPTTGSTSTDSSSSVPKSKDS